ncbi:hypothetical protein [Xanthomonas translucens]|uniref:hypothetical protein n=1 Tax=Xanthomonas campestris pv. translucens TaxID=343 RepID=UPI0012D9EAF1|nr:hypothetical protein [Xanthomonas translucens]MCS3358274.1 hypothetical protein [Xanthomonas translucens pv. translucens]MCS3371807.1 hypothetical protein [Xanthomonas translucens pv. translucens]MCT8274079.1 hypothetical protein [Xanthomonas translucens pv. translucens]MCT8277991.1 hypothetical protein [Xanthomonas translucens pv. translucens]MCT8287822.1 hypothetical protein [Xanthomonas translucens pv. translucens]
MQQKRAVGWLCALLAFTWAIAALRWVVVQRVWMSSDGRVGLGVMAGCRGVRAIAQMQLLEQEQEQELSRRRRESLLSWQK